jgi:hypothetical protein
MLLKKDKFKNTHKKAPKMEKIEKQSKQNK